MTAKFKVFKKALWFIYDLVLVYIIGFVYLLVEFLGKHQKPSGIKDRNGEVAIVTGGSRGIGLEVAKQFLAEGMHVIIVSSNTVNGANLLKELQSEFPQGKVEYRKLDLSSIESVKIFASEFLARNLPLHVLVNNAGIMFVPYSTTNDGFESHFQINYLGHFLLTYLLLPRLRESGTEERRARIVNVTSCCHYAGRIKLDDLNSSEYYSAHGSYSQTKLAQVMSSMKLQTLLDKENAHVAVNAVHPGIVNTKLYQYTWFDLLPLITQWFFKTPEQGADGVVHVALSDKIEGTGGKYYENCTETRQARRAFDETVRAALWEETCRLLEIDDYKP